jgi:hypothetical protein
MSNRSSATAGLEDGTLTSQSEARNTQAGFEEFVGSKTTVRFVNRLHFGFQERPSEAVMQQVTTPEVLQEFIAQKREMPAQKLFMVSPDFHRFVVRQLAAPPTNGLYGVFFALQRCRSITLLGFVRGGDAHVPYHYFDTDAPVTNQRRRDLQVPSHNLSSLKSTRFGVWRLAPRSTYLRLACAVHRPAEATAAFVGSHRPCVRAYGRTTPA